MARLPDNFIRIDFGKLCPVHGHPITKEDQDLKKCPKCQRPLLVKKNSYSSMPKHMVLCS